MEAANLAIFVKFGNANKLDICVIFTKKSWVATKLGGLEQNWGAAPTPSPGLKPTGVVFTTSVAELLLDLSQKI